MFCRYAKRVTHLKANPSSGQYEVDLTFDGFSTFARTAVGYAIEEVAFIVTQSVNDSSSADVQTYEKSTKKASFCGDDFDPYYVPGLLPSDLEASMGSVNPIAIGAVADDDCGGDVSAPIGSLAKGTRRFQEASFLKSNMTGSDDIAFQRAVSPVISKVKNGDANGEDAPELLIRLSSATVTFPSLPLVELNARYEALSGQSPLPVLQNELDLQVEMPLYSSLISWGLHHQQEADQVVASAIFSLGGIAFEDLRIKAFIGSLPGHRIHGRDASDCHLSVVVTCIPLDSLLFDAPSGSAFPKRSEKFLPSPKSWLNIDSTEGVNEFNLGANASQKYGIYHPSAQALKSISDSNGMGSRDVGPRLFNLASLLVKQAAYYETLPIQIRVAFVAAYTKFMLLVSHSLASARRANHSSSFLLKADRIIIPLIQDLMIKKRDDSTGCYSLSNGEVLLLASLVYDKSALRLVQSSSASFGGPHRFDVSTFVDSIHSPNLLCSENEDHIDSCLDSNANDEENFDHAVSWSDRAGIALQLSYFSECSDITRSFQEFIDDGQQGVYRDTKPEFLANGPVSTKTAQQRINEDLAMSLSQSSNPEYHIPNALATLSSYFNHVISNGSDIVATPLSASALLWAERAFAFESCVPASLMLKAIVIPLIRLSSKVWDWRGPKSQNITGDDTMSSKTGSQEQEQEQVLSTYYQGSRDAGLALRASGQVAKLVLKLMQSSIKWLSSESNLDAVIEAQAQGREFGALNYHIAAFLSAIQAISTACAHSSSNKTRDNIAPSLVLCSLPNLLKLRSLEVHLKLRPVAFVGDIQNTRSTRGSRGVCFDSLHEDSLEDQYESEGDDLSFCDEKNCDLAGQLLLEGATKDALTHDQLCSFYATYDPLSFSLLFSLKVFANYCRKGYEGVIKAALKNVSDFGVSDLEIMLLKIVSPQFPAGVAVTLLRNIHTLEFANRPQIRSDEENVLKSLQGISTNKDENVQVADGNIVRFSSQATFLASSAKGGVSSFTKVLLSQLSHCRNAAVTALYLLSKIDIVRYDKLNQSIESFIRAITDNYDSLLTCFSYPLRVEGDGGGELRSLVLSSRHSAVSMITKLVPLLRDGIFTGSYDSQSLPEIPRYDTSFARSNWLSLSSLLSIALDPFLLSIREHVRLSLEYKTTNIELSNDWPLSVTSLSTLHNLVSTILEFSLKTSGRGSDSGKPVLPAFSMVISRTLGILTSLLIDLSDATSENEDNDADISCERESSMLPRIFVHKESLQYYTNDRRVLFTIPLNAPPTCTKMKKFGCFPVDAALAVIFEGQMESICESIITSGHSMSPFATRSLHHIISLIFGSRSDDGISFFPNEDCPISSSLKSFSENLLILTLSMLSRSELRAQRESVVLLSRLLSVACPRSLHAFDMSIQTEALRLDLEEKRSALFLQTFATLTNPIFFREFTDANSYRSSVCILSNLISSFPKWDSSSSLQPTINSICDTLETVWLPMTQGFMKATLGAIKSEGFCWFIGSTEIRIGEPVRSDDIILSASLLADCLQLAVRNIEMGLERTLTENLKAFNGPDFAEVFQRLSLLTCSLKLQFEAALNLLAEKPHPTILPCLAKALGSTCKILIRLNSVLTHSLIIHQGLTRIELDSPYITLYHNFGALMSEMCLLPLLTLEAILSEQRSHEEAKASCIKRVCFSRTTFDAFSNLLVEILRYGADASTEWLSRGSIDSKMATENLKLFSRLSVIPSLQYACSVLDQGYGRHNSDTEVFDAIVLSGMRSVIPQLYGLAGEIVSLICSLDELHPPPPSSDPKRGIHTRDIVSIFSEILGTTSSAMEPSGVCQTVSDYKFLFDSYFKFLGGLASRPLSSLGSIAMQSCLEILQGDVFFIGFMQLLDGAQEQVSIPTDDIKYLKSFLHTLKLNSSSTKDKKVALGTHSHRIDTSEGVSILANAGERFTEASVVLNEVLEKAHWIVDIFQQQNAFPTRCFPTSSNNKSDEVVWSQLLSNNDAGSLDGLECKQDYFSKDCDAYRMPDQLGDKYEQFATSSKFNRSYQDSPAVNLLDSYLKCVQITSFSWKSCSNSSQLETMRLCTQWLLMVAQLTHSLNTEFCKGIIHCSSYNNDEVYSRQDLNKLIQHARALALPDLFNVNQDWSPFSCLDGLSNPLTHGDLIDRCHYLVNTLVQDLQDSKLVEAWASLGLVDAKYSVASDSDETATKQPKGNQEKGSKRKKVYGDYDADLLALGVKILDSDSDEDSDDFDFDAETASCEPASIAKDYNSEQIATSHVLEAGGMHKEIGEMPESESSTEGSDITSSDELDEMIRVIDDDVAQSDGFESDGTACRPWYPSGKEFSKSPFKRTLKSNSPVLERDSHSSEVVSSQGSPIHSSQDDLVNGILIRDDTESYQPSLEQDSIFPSRGDATAEGNPQQKLTLLARLPESLRRRYLGKLADDSYASGYLHEISATENASKAYGETTAPKFRTATRGPRPKTASFQRQRPKPSYIDDRTTYSHVDETQVEIEIDLESRPQTSTRPSNVSKDGNLEVYNHAPSPSRLGRLMNESGHQLESQGPEAISDTNQTILQIVSMIYQNQVRQQHQGQEQLESLYVQPSSSAFDSPVPRHGQSDGEKVGLSSYGLPGEHRLLTTPPQPFRTPLAQKQTSVLKSSLAKPSSLHQGILDSVRSRLEAQQSKLAKLARSLNLPETPNPPTLSQVSPLPTPSWKTLLTASTAIGDARKIIVDKEQNSPNFSPQILKRAKEYLPNRSREAMDKQELDPELKNGLSLSERLEAIRKAKLLDTIKDRSLWKQASLTHTSRARTGVEGWPRNPNHTTIDSPSARILRAYVYSLPNKTSDELENFIQ